MRKLLFRMLNRKRYCPGQSDYSFHLTGSVVGIEMSVLIIKAFLIRKASHTSPQS